MSRSLILRALITTIAVLALAAAAPATDWPQWRGANRDGRSAETGLLQGWPEGGPVLAWKASGLGGGYSSVSVAGERIFTMGDLGDGQYVLALSRADGKELWKTRVGDTHKDQYLGPRSTPTVDGDHIYVVSTDGDVVCLAADSGEVQWRRSLPEQFGGRLMKAMGTYDWKFAESPLVDGERLIITPGANDAALVALNKSDGEEIWRTAIPELGEAGTDGAGYSSVVVSEAGGIRQYVQLLGRGLIGVEASSGRFLWGYNRVANDVANIATPLVQGDLIFASTGYGTGAALLRLAADGDRHQCRGGLLPRCRHLPEPPRRSAAARRSRLHRHRSQQGLPARRRAGHRQGGLGPDP